MESENDNKSTDNGSQSQEPTDQQPPRSKLRDLRPEKDPMGARNSTLAADAERRGAASN